MKTNGQINHGGFLKGEAGGKYCQFIAIKHSFYYFFVILGKYYQAYAKYIVKFIQEYAKNNVSIWGLTPANEPGFGKLHDDIALVTN